MQAFGEDTNGQIKLENIEKELQKKYENAQVTQSGKNLNVKLTNRQYKVKQNGEVRLYEEIEPTKIFAKLENDGTLKLRATKLDGYEEGTKWNSSDILKVIIEEPIAPKTASEMFKGCYNLKSIENIENLHTENVTSMYYMFYDCGRLETLDVSNFETRKVNTMRAMFGNCRSLKSLDLSNFNTQNVNNMLRMFDGCVLLDSLDLSGFDTKKVENMNWMFRDCYNLSHLNLENFDTSNVYNMEYMFGVCYNLTTIDVSSFNTNKVKSMAMMFNGCTGLIDLDVSHFDMSSVTDLHAMFRSCSNLSNESLNNILYMCKNANQISDKTLKYLDMPSAKAQACNTLSYYNAFTEAGWTIGY